MRNRTIPLWMFLTVCLFLCAVACVPQTQTGEKIGTTTTVTVAEAAIKSTDTETAGTTSTISQATEEVPDTTTTTKVTAPIESVRTSGNPTRPIATNGASTVYVRTDGGINCVFPKATLIRSVEELVAYYEENKTLFDLERREYNDGFLNVCEAFDASYFSKHFLVLVTLEEGSGSIRHDVKRVMMTVEGRLEIDIEAFAPEILTCDMAQWHLFVRPASGVSASDIQEIKVNKIYHTATSRTGDGCCTN